jgi:hypothetical protein
MLDVDPSYLIASMLVSSVGFVLFSYGKKQRRFPHTALGIVLLVYPYFVTNVALMLTIGGVLMGLLFALVKLGI